MIKTNFSKILCFSLSAFFLVTIFSCETDVEGCMDSLANNFNPNAVTDSGNCTYDADPLIGSYTGTTECDGSLVNPQFNTSSFAFSIAKSSTGGVNDVELTMNFGGDPFVFKGTVIGNVLDINDEIFDVMFPDAADNTMMILVDVEAIGTFTFSSDDTTIACPSFYMKIKSAQSGALKQDGICIISGKQ